jgi:hypothetical protein
MGLVISNVQREALRVWAGNGHYFHYEITLEEANEFLHYDQSRV